MTGVADEFNGRLEMTKVAHKLSAAEALASTALDEDSVPEISENREETVNRFSKRFRELRKGYSKLTRAELETTAAELAAVEYEWKIHSDRAIRALAAAADAIRESEAKADAAEELVALRRRQSSLGGKTAHRNSRKAIDKQNAHVFWLAWQNGKHSRIRNKKQFASKVLSTPGTSLESMESIMRWMREWTKALVK